MSVALSTALVIGFSITGSAAAQDDASVLVMVEARSVDATELRQAVQARFDGRILGLGDERALQATRQLTIALSERDSMLTLFYQDSFDRRIVRSYRRDRQETVPWIAELAAVLLRETAPPRWFVVSEVIDPFAPSGNHARGAEVIDPFVTPRRSSVIDPWAVPRVRRRMREGASGLDRPPPPRR